jgi:SPP1 gp7 family putative phage head morphogenesis protein
LAHLYGDITLTYDLSNVPALREDYGKKVEQAARLWSMGVPFEQINAKLEMGFDEFPGWDVGYLPLSLLPTGYSGSSEEKQFKAIETEDAKVQYWKRLDRRRIGWWGAAEKKILPLFENEKDEVLKAIKSGDPMTAAENAITKQKDKWLEVMTAITTAIVEDFGNDIAQDLGAERKWRFDPFKPAAMQWIIGHAADSVTTILNTNKNDIKNIILRGMADNLPTPDIADEISKFYNDRSEYKSMRIARTEVAAASGYGSLEAARQSGIVERKKWLSSRDDRVRDSHQAIDGEEVPLDGTFSNGCEAPGVGGDPAETIQCRCVLQFVTRRT